MKQTIGIVGGGQLGRMLTGAAHELGFLVTVLDPTPDSPAGQIADKQIVGSFTDKEKIFELANESDFVTFEIESANAEALEELTKKGYPVNPSSKTLTIIKDKFKQKEFLKAAGVPTAESIEVKSSSAFVIASETKQSQQQEIAAPPSGVRNDTEIKNEIETIAKEVGYPFLLKARFGAYDGRGNALIQTEEEIPSGLEKLANRALYIEKFVPFVTELAIMIARNTAGDIVPFQVVETTHKHNICHTVVVPAPVSEEVAHKAKEFAISVMQHLQGAGVFGIEMFLTKDDNVFVNEIAPRVHNAGHYTIEANKTSQFAQHIRAITGMPLGSTYLVVPAAAMVNILGERNGPVQLSGEEKALEIPGVSVHIYGKKETKIERKMGHITAVADTAEEALQNALKARSLITI